MKLLVIGGTRFVGYHMVTAALARGHEVTVFHRGESGPAPAGAEDLRGDRRGDLAPLAGRRWDAVLDTCGYVPAAVESSARLLASAVDRYAFVSSISAYQPPAQSGLDERAPLLGPPADPTTETITAETYGPLKVLCEQTVERLMPGRALLIRPGIVVGPRDDSDRFTYWAARIARGGDVLVPAPAERPVQLIDARDLGAWTIQAIERQLVGAYHLIGPREPLTMAGLFEACRAATGSDARAVWVDADFIAAQAGSEASLAGDFPFWADAAHQAIFTLDPARAIATGLSLRPLAETIRDTLAWLAADRPNGSLKLGPSPAVEARVLARWAERAR